MADIQMSINDIIIKLRQFNINIISDKEFSDSDGLENLYIQCAKFVYGTQLDQISKQSQKGQQLVNLEVDQNSLNKFHFQDKIYKLMKVIGVHDFSFLDIIKPDKIRQKKIFTNLIKFMQFKQEKLEYFKDQLDRNKEIDQQSIKQQQKLKKYQEDLDRLKQRKQNEKSDCEILQKEINTLISNLENLKQNKSQKEIFYHDIRQQQNQYKVKLDDQLKQIQRLKQEKENLHCQIVINPEKIMQEHSEVQTKIDQKRHDILQIENQLQNNIQISNILDDFKHQFSENCLKLVSQLRNLDQKNEGLKKHNQQMQQENEKILKQFHLKEEEQQDYKTRTLDQISYQLTFENQKDEELKKIKAKQDFINQQKQNYILILEKSFNEQKEYLNLINSTQKTKNNLQNELEQYMIEAKEEQTLILEAFETYKVNIQTMVNQL